MREETVRRAIRLAVSRFGSEAGIFNAAGFSGAMRELSGVAQTLDGGMVRAILEGRLDVEPLEGGAHFRFLDLTGNRPTSLAPLSAAFGMSDVKLRSSLIRLAHSKPELRGTLLPLLKSAAGVLRYAPESVGKAAAGKTYAEAKAAVMDYLKSKGWKLSAPGLKVPHATSPDGKIRFWFKTQAVYFTNGNQHSLNGARTVSYDTDEIKKKTPQQYVEDAEAFARRED